MLPSAQCMIFIFLLLHSGTINAKDPLRILDTISRHFRQGNRYDEGQVVDTPIKKILKQKRYDFIVIGAGTAGSVIANRLSANPSWKVLLLEAGKDEMHLNQIPAFCAHLMFTDYSWGYQVEPQEFACLGMKDKRCNWPRGKALGGSSSINYMIYTRGNKLDYDQWASMGNTGWSYDDVLPYFKKSENIEIPELMNSTYHSTGGYLNVEDVPFHTPLANAFVSAGEELGYDKVDYNGESQMGFSNIQANLRNGSRCSASKAFLRPIRHRKNLHISMNTRVSKILIDEESKQVVGVEFYKNRAIHRVKVKKEVVLSAGTLNSPQILMLSGIGPREHLESINIPVLKDLQVGQNLQEHVGFLGTVALVNDTVGFLESRKLEREIAMKVVTDFLLKGQGPLTSIGGIEGIAFVRTKHAPDARPDVELLLTSVSMMTEDFKGVVRRSFNVKYSLYRDVYSKYQRSYSYTIVPIVIRPRSRGEVKLKDNNPFHWPKFYGNFLTDPHDVKTLVEGIKIAVKLMETNAFQKYGSKLHSVPIPGCESFDFGTDDYWVCASRHLTAVVHHQTGTCKMGPASDPDAVVDPLLRVYGIKGLRVADASIMPLMPTAHTNAVVYMIGEKAADLIKTDWR